ncbi:MAG: hypothetical protein PHE73_08775 [Sulfurovaceae bacterium]|nr:hypothetical protein [Sulfurovaceae bacterium]
MKKIVVKRKDGGVSIIIPTHEATPETILRDVLRVEGYVSHREINEDKLPQDRIFRDAWTDDNPTETVDVHIEKAKEIKKDHLRQMRKPLFEKLDIEFIQAVEKGDINTQKQIADKKQKLRDITKVDLPSTVEELKNFVPEDLK